MNLLVKVFPKSHENTVSRIDETHYTVRTTAPADKDKANKAVIKLLARHFGLPLSAVSVIRGATNRNKIIEVRP